MSISRTGPPSSQHGLTNGEIRNEKNNFISTISNNTLIFFFF